MRRRTKILVAVGVAAGAAAIAAVVVPLSTRGSATASLSTSVLENVSDATAPADSKQQTTLSVMTLNIAHGRRDALHQALQRRKTIVANLDRIAEVLVREKPDAVALQEADGPSSWSGKFDHVEHLAKGAQFRYFCRGEHVKGMKLAYGTALLSRGPLSDCRSITFPPSPPTFSKGFVVGTIPWPGQTDVQVDLVSVHLDFARKSVRTKQIRRMIDELSERDRPLIIMGDFNCQWTDKDSPLRTLAERLDLAAYRPKADDMATFIGSEKRLDWILVSSDLEFVRYETIADVLSDHRGVLAVLKLAR